MKKILAIITLIFLTNCSYKPLINPETSRDKWTGESIAGDYYKDLQACNYIWERETKTLILRNSVSLKCNCNRDRIGCISLVLD